MGERGLDFCQAMAYPSVCICLYTLHRKSTKPANENREKKKEEQQSEGRSHFGGGLDFPSSFRISYIFAHVSQPFLLLSFTYEKNHPELLLTNKQASRCSPPRWPLTGGLYSLIGLEHCDGLETRQIVLY